MTALPLTTMVQLAFSMHENKGVYAVLLGSGLSRAAGVPTGWEITLDLIRRVATSSGISHQADWAAWHRTTAGAEPNYSTLLEQLASTPEERRAILHSYIEPTPEEREEGQKMPTAAHRSIARLVQMGYIRVIVTPNFDRLMENALREIGVEPTIITSVDTLKGAEPLAHSKCYLLKLHGDYKDARILNTEAELQHYPPEYEQLLDRIFDEFGLITCGWSGEWDEGLRSAILRAPNRRYPLYWASRGNPGSRAMDIIGFRRGRIIPIDGADSFFSQLLQLVETAEQTRKQHPDSVELLVNSAKRYLGKSEFRIQLEGLIEQEVERLLLQLEDPLFDVNKGNTPQEFRERIRRYEAAAEPLSKIAGAVGRWGDDTSDAIILEMLQTLHKPAMGIANGTSPWLGLRLYPAVLAFTAFGVGLTRAKRWHSLHRLFTLPLRPPHGDPTRLVDKLFLGTWQDIDDTHWQQLEGLERRHTPLSDHLHTTMERWGKSFMGVVSDFELLFERFEVLGSLAHLDACEAAQLRAELERSDGMEWMPVGRSAWKHENRKALFQELQSAELRDALIKAGFGRGQPDFLDVFMSNFARVSRLVARYRR